MTKNEKAQVIDEIKQLIEGSTAVYLVNYEGVNVEDINNLRGEFKKEGVTYKVLKNTLFLRAAEEIGGYDEFKNVLPGMTGYAFAGDNNYVAPAKIIKKYNDDTKKLDLKGCYIDKDFYGPDQLKTLATMPTKEEVMASIVGSIAAPASGIVGAINAVMRDLVNVVDQISKKEAA